MATVVDINKAKIDRLAAEMLPALRDAFTSSGYYMANVEDVDDVELWRRAARKCARTLGVKVRTAIATDGKTVWIVDESPSTPAERERAVRALGKVMRDLQRPEDET